MRPQRMNNDPVIVEQLFTAALQRANHIERHVFLSSACGNDASLWNEVWDRLRNRPVTRTGVGRQRKTRGIKVTKSPGPSEKPGDMVGPYHLLQILDESASGVVWMAERGQQVTDFVAVKIMTAEAANDFLTRYEAQKHALALLDHPGIARPHACGMTSGGNPYLVTELAHGEPLTKFCNDQKLSLLMRTRLFLQACDALHHAHQKGVVHGDLKPANFLARWGENGQPVLKITGFGTASALNHVLVTPGGGLRMPAAWFSPEHLSAGTIDARSDIYALGVLLHELLTDRPPFAMPEETADHLAEVRRVICESALRRPSECLAALPKAQLAGIALNRRAEPAEIVALMERHFDGIVTRMLDKRPLNRPSTASTLAGELQLYLSEAEVEEDEKKQQAQETVTGGFFSEHRGLFALAAVLVALLVLGMTIVGWLLVRERQEETRVAGRRKTESHSLTAQFLQDMFATLTPEKVKGHDTTLLKNMLDEAAGNLEALSGHPEAGARTQETIGLTYLALSQPADAQKQLQGALEKRTLALGGAHRDTLRSMKDLATALKEQGRHEEAEGLLRRALQGQQRSLGPDHPDTFVTISVLAAVCDAQEKRVEAEQLYLQLYQVQKRVLGPDHLDTLATIGSLASSFTAQGRHAEALKLREEQLQATQRVLGGSAPQTLVTMNITAQAAEAGGMPSEAEKLYFGALEIMKQTLGMEHPGTLEQMDRAASMLGRQGRHDEAVKLYRQSLRAKQQVLGASHPQTLLSMRCLADEFEAQGRRDEAENTQTNVLETLKTAFPPDHPEILSQMDHVAQTFEHHGKHAQAVDLRRHAFEARSHTLGGTHPQTLRSMRQLAVACDAAGRQAEAETLHLQTLEAMKTAYGPGDPDVLVQMRAVALMHDRHGKHAEAEALLRQMLQIQQRALGPEHVETLDTMACLGETFLHAGRWSDAEELLRQCLSLKIKFSPSHWRRFDVESLLGAALLEQQKLAEAEPLLRSGHEGLRTLGNELPEAARPRLQQALERLARFTGSASATAQTPALPQP